MTAHQPAPARDDWRTAFPAAPADALVQLGQSGVGGAAQGQVIGERKE